MACRAYDTAGDDTELLAAAMHVVTAAPDRYEELLGTIAQDDPDYAQALAQTVSNTLAEWSGMEHEREFQQSMRASEQANVEHAKESLQALADVRQMTPDDVERAAGRTARRRASRCARR